MLSPISSTTKHIYIQDFKKIIDYLGDNEYIEKIHIDIPNGKEAEKIPYTDDEVKRLLKKPSKKATFGEIRSYTIVSMFLSTGIRSKSLREMRCEDIDIVGCLIKIRHTKNHKPLTVPISKTLVITLKNYIAIRQGEPKDYLFCNMYGEQMTKPCLTNSIVRYNLSRGVKTRGLHRFRHTFTRLYLNNGGSLQGLKKILGHSSLSITDKYVHTLMSDVTEEVNKVDVLGSFNSGYRFKK